MQLMGGQLVLGQLVLGQQLVQLVLLVPVQPVVLVEQSD
jgi:hypothetical protein